MQSQQFCMMAFAVALGSTLTSPTALSQATTPMPGHQHMMQGTPMPMNGAQMAQCMDQMKDLGPSDNNYDKRFIDMMIMHHQGALDMSRDALSKAHHPELKQMARHVLNEQQQQIRQLQEWRTKWFSGSNAR